MYVVIDFCVACRSRCQLRWICINVYCTIVLYGNEVCRHSKKKKRLWSLFMFMHDARIDLILVGGRYFKLYSSCSSELFLQFRAVPSWIYAIYVHCLQTFSVCPLETHSFPSSSSLYSCRWLFLLPSLVHPLTLYLIVILPDLFRSQFCLLLYFVDWLAGFAVITVSPQKYFCIMWVF